MDGSSNGTRFLNLNQTPKELANLYGRLDYYWYLRSTEFQETFLKPLGRMVGVRGCLDVGCGEGQLSDHIVDGSRYLGVDGSASAIHYGKLKGRNVLQGRFELPEPSWGIFEVVVFGGVLSVLIKPEHRLDFVRMYTNLFKVSRYIVYDLQELDTSFLEATDRVVSRYQGTAEVEGLQEVKKHRKVLEFEVVD